MSKLAWFKVEGSSIRYHVDHDDGTWDESKLPTAPVREETRRTHKSLQSVIEKRLGLDEQPEIVQEIVEPNEELPEATEGRHTHAEFDVAPEHDHNELKQALEGVTEAVSRLTALMQSHGHNYAPEGHAHPDLETAHADAAVRAAHTATEVARLAEEMANHNAKRDIHAVPDLSGFVTVEQVNAAFEGLIARVVALEERPALPSHHHTTEPDKRNIEELVPQLESRLEAIEKAQKPRIEEVKTEPPHVHEYNTKGSHRGEWLCDCGESMNTGR